VTLLSLISHTLNLNLAYDLDLQTDLVEVEMTQRANIYEVSGAVGAKVVAGTTDRRRPYVGQ